MFICRLYRNSLSNVNNRSLDVQTTVLFLLNFICSSSVLFCSALALAWSSLPLSAVIIGEVEYGFGTEDMKTAVVIIKDVHATYQRRCCWVSNSSRRQCGWLTPPNQQYLGNGGEGGWVGGWVRGWGG